MASPRDPDLAKTAQAVLSAMQQARHALTLEDLQSRLSQQQATVLGFELRTLCAALEEEGHLRRDPASLAPGKVLAYRPGPLIGQALDLRALRLDLRLRQKPLPMHTPDSPRIAHGRAPSVFALEEEIAQEDREEEKVLRFDDEKSVISQN